MLGEINFTSFVPDLRWRGSLDLKSIKSATMEYFLKQPATLNTEVSD